MGEEVDDLVTDFEHEIEEKINKNSGRSPKEKKRRNDLSQKWSNLYNAYIEIFVFDGINF